MESFSLLYTYYNIKLTFWSRKFQYAMQADMVREAEEYAAGELDRTIQIHCKLDCLESAGTVAVEKFAWKNTVAR